MTLYEIIKKLQNASGNNAKKAILEDNCDNMVLRDYLKATYDPRLNYFLSEKTYPEVCGYSDNHEFTVNNIGEFIYQLADRNKTGNAAKEWLKSVLRYFNEEQQELIKMMLLKDIKAGISVSTINKIWPDLIFVQNYMRCSLPSAVKLKDWNWEEGVYSQEKMDGMYAAITNNSVTTRAGNSFPVGCLPESFKEEMQSIPEGVELNGELLVYRNGFVLSRKEGNGILNSLLQGLPIPEYCKLNYVAWDGLGLEGDYKDRSFQAGILCYRKKYFSFVKNRLVYSIQEATEHFQELLAEGKEGTVLKNPKGLWKDGTSKDCVKFKIEAEIDLFCIGIAEGTGKYKGMLGALQLQSACGSVLVDCGTGFTDKMRNELWETPPIGKVVSIKANDLLDKVGSDILSLFLPVFLEIREDKTTADTLERIQHIFDSAKGLA